MKNHQISLSKRLDTVLKGKIPDRIPCVPLIYYFAATYAGVPYPEFTTSMRAYRKAMDLCYSEVGPWDAMYPLPITMDAPEYDIVWGAGVGMKPVVTKNKSDMVQSFQFSGDITMLNEHDYEKILQHSPLGRGHTFIKFLELLVARSAGKKSGARFKFSYLLPHVLRFGGKWLTEILRWKFRGVPYLSGMSLEAPFDTISMARGIEEFCYDMVKREKELSSVVMKLSKSYAYVARLLCKLLRAKNFLLLVHRSSNDFISPTHYKKFVHPALKVIASELNQNGITMGLHCDGNWIYNLEHMTDLPENTFFQMDGYTDIIKSREILGDKFTIMGDVPATLLARGSSNEVDEYCHKIIDGVGMNGRFILSSGCEVPPDAKPENVRTMISSVERYGKGRS